MKRVVTRTWLLILPVLLVIFTAFAASLQAQLLPLSSSQQLQAAWQAATAIGRFHYQTQVLQTTHPTVSLQNAGRQVKTKQMRVEGAIDLPGERMALQLHTSQGGQERVTELKVEQGQAFGRLDPHSEWTPLEQATALFAPGGDPLGFLVAAENVKQGRLGDWEIQRLGTLEQSLNLPISQSPNNLLEQALPSAYLATLTRYTFDLNGVKYAEYMRGQMAETLRRKGELPNNVNLAPVRAYVDMTGSGEIWVNAAGLPVRQMINIQFPPEQGASEWLEAQIATNFTDWPPTSTATFSQLWQDPTHLGSNILALGRITPRQINEAAIRVSLFLCMGGLAFLLIRYRRSRRIYVGLAAAIIGAMVVIPLLDAQQLYAFSARQQVKAASQNNEKVIQDELEATQAASAGRNFNPELNPLANTTTDLGSSGFVDTQHATRNTQHAAFANCDTPVDTDCDDDGLSNEAEIHKLGTSAYDVDSDNDLISDRLEVEGVLFNGKRWYLDPLNPDSNGDGLPDGVECPGLSDVTTAGAFRTNFVATGCRNTDSTTANSDTTPDLFDFDNDGDGVPDGVDDAPFSVVGNTSTGLSDQQLAFNLAFTGTAKPLFVDFAVRPLNADHLWQTNNVLDWPGNDTQGQIQRVHDTTYADRDGYEGVPNASNGDMILIPLLEFEITYNAANPSAGLPISGTYNVANIKNYGDLAWLDTAALAQLGISARTGANDQTLLLWAPLNLVYDTVGDTPVAWQARMMYRPRTGVNNLGNDQNVRLLWMVQVLTDRCDTTDMGDEDPESWCADHTHWTTAPTVVQTYYDDFYVTSLTAREDHGGQLALLAEPDNVGNPNYDDHLWHLADTLQSALIGAQAKPDGSRFGVADIASYRTAWGVGNLAQTNITLANELELAKVAATGSTDMLNRVFPQAATGSNTTLLFAGEQTVRNAALSDASASLSANRVQLNLTANPLQTTAALRWSPYSYRGAGVWEALAVGDYLDTLAVSGSAPTLPPVFSNSQIDLLAAGEAVSDYDLLRAGAVRLAQIYYLSLTLGVTQLVAENGSRVGAETLGSHALGSSEPAVTIVQRLLAEIQAYYADTAVVAALTSTSETITAANALSASFAVSLSALLQAFGNVAQGNTNSALTLALNKLSDYYKVTALPSTPFTDAVSMAGVGWMSTVSAIVVKYGDTDLGDGISLGHLLAVGGTFIYSAYNTISTLTTILAVMQYRAAIAIVDAPGTAAAVTMEAASTAKAIKFTNNAFAVATFIVTVAIVWTLYGIGKYSNHLQRNAAVFKAVAETIVAAIMLVIALIPVAGWIIVAVIGLISALMMAVCAIYNASSKDDIKAGGHVDRFVCGGITGALSSALVYAIYDQYVVVDLADADRLDVVVNLPETVQNGANAGLIVGNQVDLSATITNTIHQNHKIGVGTAEAVGLGTHDLKAMFDNATFLYTLQTSKTDHHSALDAGLVDWTDLSLSGGWYKAQAVFTPTHSVRFTVAGLNQSTQLYLTESYHIPALECWGFIIQGCQRSDIADSNHIDLGDDFVFDVLPATFDDFLQFSADNNNGYRQRWDGTLPTLKDGDGDGLLSQAAGGADPDDSQWDSDDDGLADFWELENSFDPANADYDNDGLSDYWEAHYATNPLLADSDNDGLTDDKEFFHPNIRNAYGKDDTAWSGGWTIVYGYNGATRLQTLVNADPNDLDSDDDTILDRQEFIYGYHPGLPSVLNVLSLDANVSATVVAPGATFDYTATVKNELDNRIANGLLQAEFPVDFVQKTQVLGTLRPLQQAALAGTLAAPNVGATTASSVTLRAGAIIEDVNTGRVLWLHLNESGNPTTLADDALSDNGPHNATCPSTNSGCPTGNGSFVSFDGADDRLTIPHHDELNLDVFTLSLWINQDVSRAQTLFAKGATGLNVSVDSSGKVRVVTYLSDCSTQVTFQSSATLPTGSWQNVVVTANGEELALYFNGVRQGAARVQTLCANDSAITLGASSSGSYLDGALDEVELYTEGKTAAEVASLWQKPVFYVSSYRDTLDTAYSRLDESDYKGATVACTANAATDFDCPTEAPGIAGDAFVFNQQNGLTVTGSDATDLSAINDTFSLSLWVYPERGYTPDDAHLTQFGKMLLGNDEQGYNKAYPSLYIKDNHLIIRFGHADGKGYCEAQAGWFFEFDQWQYVSVVFDGAQFKVYKNGVLKNSVTGSNCAGKQLYPQRDFYIGNGRSPAIYFSQFETDEDPVNDEGFLWSADTRRDNGYGRRELVWMSGWHDMDSHDTLTINQWADVTETTLSYSMCNADENVVGDGCEGENEYFTLFDDSRVRTVNFYDTLGTVADERWHNAHGDGSDDARTWAGYLTYKLYNDGFKGKLDEIKIYRTVLDANAINAAYASSIRSLELTFDEAPGQDIFTDSSGNGYTGNCATTSCPDSGIPGRDNQAARFDGGMADDDGFDGVADYITLDNAQKLGIKDGSFTVLAWIKPDTISGLDTVLGADAGATNNGLGLALNSGKPYFTFNNNDTASGTTLSANRWTHLAWRYDKNAQEQAIFINGLLDVAQTGKPPMTGATLLRVGRSRSSNYFDGLIDHLVIVKAALTPAEIAAIMNEAPLLNLHLDEDLATTTFTNDSPIGLSPTCVGTACPTAGAKGQVREAPIFDGNDLLTTDLTGKVSNARKVSVGMWVKPAQQKNTAQFLWKSGPVNLFVQPNSSTLGVETGYYHYCGFDTIADFTAALLTNQWNHVLVTLNEIAGSHDTYPSVKVAVYINGVYVTGGTKAIACPQISTVTLGQNFEGSLDEVVFYDSVLSAEAVAALYEYQSTWFDLTYQQLVTIDADQPLVNVALGSAYLAYQPYWLTISAMDASSAVTSVTTRLTRPNGTVVNGVATQSDGSGNSGAWLYEFTPTAAGQYTLEATATDQVGNRRVTSATFAVDNALPAITLASEQLTATLQTRQTPDGIVLDLGGEATDADGIANSGVNTATVAIRVLDRQGAEVQGQRLVDLSMNSDGTAGAWHSAYPFNVSGYGRYRVESSIADQVGNTLTNTLGMVTVDDYGPTGDIALTSRVISEAVGTLAGVITDIPYATAGKLVHLHFEENAGASVFSDSARDHFTVTCSSGTCPTAGQSGHNGRAVSFDGTNDALTIANGADLETGAMTLLAWVKPSWSAGAKGYNPTILGLGDSTNSGYRWQLADNYQSMILSTGATTASVPVNLAANTWHHLALVHDGTTWTGYVDGIPAGVITQSVGSLTGLDLHLGAATSSAGFFQGLLDEVAIYNRALSDEELYDLANPLPTGISSAAIRFRHAKDGDQGENEGNWLPLTVTPTGAANFVTWRHPLPSGLEGPYKIDLRATDSLGNASYIPNVWFGEIDTAAPRLDFAYTLTGNGYAQVACRVTDYTLVSAGVTCPQTNLTAVAEDAAWFTDLFGVYTKTVTLEAKLQTAPVSDSGPRTFSACDGVGHCASQTITPSIGSNVVTMLNPGGAATYTTTAPLTLNGYAASDDGIYNLRVTINGQVIYAQNYLVPITQTTWSTTWTPHAGVYTAEAIVNYGLNQAFSDPVDTVLTFVAPNLTVNKTVKPTSKLRAGDAVTYTVVFGNNGMADANNVVISDTLPAAVSGNNLSTTINLAAGQRVTYTIPATVRAGDDFTATNTAVISHTWQKTSASASFTRCDRLLVTNANGRGPGSLRQAISDACTDDAVIRFAGNYTIYLDSTLAINKRLTIDGYGRTVTISGDSGNNGSRNVQLFNIGASGAVTLTRLSLVDGTASRGGALANAGTLTVIDSRFWRNRGGSSPGGGAIYSTNTLTVIGSTFTDNASTRGGALLVEGVAELRNSTLTANSATEGSGIHNRGVLTMTNVTGSNGGALHNWNGTVYLHNSILANNGLKDCFNEGVIAGNRNNLIESGNCGATLTADPILGDLTAFPSTSSGNVQWVLPLLPGSLALNTGDNATCETGDQRGQPRYGVCDIGAFESQGFTLTLTSGDNQIGQIGERFAQPLVFTVQPRASNEPVQGGNVIINAPLPGASLAMSNTVGILDLSGIATIPVTANQTVGSYLVTAAIGAEQGVSALNLTNISLDLMISQSATPTTVVGGDLITYTLAYTNVGTTNAISVTITDTLPSGVTVQQVTTNGVTMTRSSNAATELFRIATLAGGQSGLITITARLSDTLTPGAILTNTATIGWPRNEANRSNNRAVASHFIPCQPAIVVTNGNDQGVGSLRQALVNLCDGGEITFAGDTTIYLDSVLALGKSVTINGRGHAVTISGDSGNNGDRNIQIFNISASAVVTLRNLSIVSGTATLGGGIYNAGVLTLDALTLQDHVAGDNGGALYNVGNLTVQNSTFVNNNSRRGGGLYNVSGYTATVTNSTFASNTTQEGGGIHNRGLLTVTNSTFAGNSGYGSSIHNWNGTLHLSNSLLTGSCINQGVLATSVHNFVADGSCNAAHRGAAYLANLGNYGGPSTGSGTATQTFALLPGSPAIEQGDPAYCPAQDQRGQNRVGPCDIGAFESQGFTMYYGGGSDQNAVVGVSFNAPLAVTITANAANEPVAGGSILLTAPANGASLSPATMTGGTTANGATVSVTANSVVGSYVVTATANGVTATAPITFALTNNTCTGATVTNANDSGAGSLRQAIDTICPGGVITFANDYTIHLSRTLALSREVTIDGSGHRIIVSGDTNDDGTPDLQPFAIAASGIVTLTRLSIMDGTGTNGSALANQGTLLLDTVTVANNYAAASNSAHLGTLYNTGTLTVKNSTFAHNETYRGGGIYHNSGTATVINSTFADNNAPEGGGIYNRSALTVTNSTFSNNSSTAGESYVNRGALVLVNTLHNGKSLTISNCQGNMPTLRLNNRSNDTTCGVDAISFNLKVMDLGDYGVAATGSEIAPQTAAIQAGSSAINAGNSAYCPSQDQRGKPRLGVCDIGAVEWQGYNLAITGGDNQRTGLNNTFAAPLQVSMAAAESFDSVPSGQTISFSAPGTGASLRSTTFNTTTNSSKIASATVSANGVNGSYLVTATASSVITPVVFTLTNDCTTAVVTNDGDAGAGSLRQALTDLCSGGTITFDDDYTIYLDSTLAISKTVTIDGDGMAVTVSGDSGNDSDRDVRVFAIAASGVVTLSHLSVVSGTVDAEQGAGIRNEGQLTLLHSTVAGNQVTGAGAGAGLANSGVLTIANSSLLNNHAPGSSVGGGLTNDGDAMIVNSTFSGNQAAVEGGAIHNLGTLTMNNSTLSANGADGNGGGLYNAGTLAMSNTIIANSPIGGDCVDAGSITTNRDNLIEDGSCNAAVTGDPNLSALGEYGGETATFSLLPGSLALDAGEEAACTATDQRGASRVGLCDIGATESQGFTMLLRAGNQQSANHDANFAQPLQVSLVASDTNLLLSDQVITFTAPSSGASLDSSPFTILTGDDGVAVAAVTANSTAGTYAVVATAFGFTTPVTFTLTNLDCYTQLVTNANDSGPGSLRRAVADACDTGVITFADDYTIYLSSTITTSKSITISDADHTITVSGDSDNDGNNDVRPFQIEAGGVVTMRDLRIVNGSAAGFNLDGTGGAILNQGALTLEGMTLGNNSSSDKGGAIANYGTLVLQDSTLANNETGDYGGGLFNASSAELTIVNSEVISNSSDNGAGIFSEGAFTIEKTLIAENGASTSYGMGGGVVSFGDTTIAESTIISNTAAMGGGLLVSGGAAVISHTIFADNLATDEGGAISSDSSLTLVNSTINRNRVASVNPDPADYIQGGGGISSIGRDTFINSTISGNTSTIDGVGRNGGGLLHAGSPGELTPEQSTLTLVNTIIADNNDGGDCVVIDDAPVDDLGHNLIGDGVAVGDGGCVGNDTTFRGEPWLAPWGYYGGESPTNALLPNSPAINGGDDAYCPTVDQRGMARFGVCDIGAFESQGFTLTVSGGDNQSTQINQPFATPLQVTVSANDPHVVIGADQIVSFSAPSSDASLANSSFTATTDAAGVVTVLVDANDVVGSYGVTATVPSSLNQANFILRNRPSNVAPTVAPLPSYTISETNPFSFTVFAADLDDDPLTFQLVDAPTSATIDANTGRFTWTPSFDQGPGIYPMTVIATDDDTPALSASALFTVTVLDLPLTYDQAVTTNENQALALELLVASANALLTYSYTMPSHGLLSGDAPNLTYTPNDQYVGSDSFTFFISDGILTSTVATVVITVNPVNVAPTADAQSVSTDEEAGLAITLTATDGDGDPITYTVTTGVLYGELGGIVPNLIYTPAVDFTGEDHFRFVADDGLLTSDEVTVTITVNAVDDVPSAYAQSLNTPEETALPITLHGSDVDSDRLTYRLVATPDHGEVGGIGPNLIYTPAVNFTGEDALLFNIDDGTNFSAVARVTISVTAVNDPPQAYTDTLTTLEDEPLSLMLLADDPEADVLSYTVVTPPLYGVIGGTAPNLVYTPSADFHGADAFTFTASDGQAWSSATISITVAPSNDAPTAVDQSLVSSEDEWLAITLTGADVDGDELTFAVIDAPQHGTVGGIAPNLVYTPDLDYHGNDSFTFATNDGGADSLPATVAITITAMNDAPSASSQSIDTDEEQPVTITLGSSDADGDALTFTLGDQPAHGMLTGIAPDLVYTPSLNFPGSAIFTFTVNDGTTDAPPATITITVDALNDQPVAVTQAITTSEEVTVAITLTGTDADGDSLNYSIITQPLSGTLGGIAPNLVYTPALDFSGTDRFTFLVNDGDADAIAVPVTITVTPRNDAPTAANGAVTTTEERAVAVTLVGLDADHDPLSYTVATLPDHGTLTGAPPNLTYTPNADYSGNDAFTFTVSDDVSPAVTATVTITVAAMNDLPLAESQVITTSEEQAITLTLTGSDVDGDPLTYTILSQPVNGVLGGIVPDLVYTPTVDFNGADSFTFSSSDGISNSLPATVTLVVEPVNDAPTTIGQSISLVEDTAAAMTLTGADGDGDPINYILLSQPEHGVLGGIAPTLFYTPSANFAGNDAFQFSVTDGAAESAAVTVTLTITPVADAPVADSQALRTEQGAPLTITLTATDTDSAVLTYIVDSAPSHGAVSGLAPVDGALGQSLIYTPDDAYLGNDAFDFTVSDGVLTTTATVSITVAARNQAPLAYSATVTTVAESTVAITLSGSDPDGDPLTYATLDQPAHGSLSGVLPNLIYAPADGFSGFDRFTFQVSDGSRQAAAAISITVQALTPTPTPTATATATTVAVPTATPTATATDSNLPTNTPTATATESAAPTATPTATTTDVGTPTLTPVATSTPTPTAGNVTATATAVATATHTPTATTTNGATPTATVSPVIVPTDTATATATLVATSTATPTPTATNVSAPTNTSTVTAPATETATPTAGNGTSTPTATADIVSTSTSTATPTTLLATATATEVGASTPTPTATVMAATVTTTPTGGITPTSTPTATSLATATLTPIATPTDVVTPTATATDAVAPTSTATATTVDASTATSTPTATTTASTTPTLTPTATSTLTPTVIHGTATATATEITTLTATVTATATETGAPTPTATSTATMTATSTTTPTTATATATETGAPTPTPMGTATATATQADLPTVTPTATSTDQPTATATPTDLPTATATATGTLVPTVTATATSTGTTTPLPTATLYRRQQVDHA